MYTWVCDWFLSAVKLHSTVAQAQWNTKCPRQSVSGAAMARRATPVKFCPLSGRFSGCRYQRFFVVFISIWMLNLLRLSLLVSIIFVCTPVLRLDLLLFNCCTLILCSCCEKLKNLFEGVLSNMSTPGMSTPGMSALQTSTPKISTSQNGQFPKCQYILTKYTV